MPGYITLHGVVEGQARKLSPVKPSLSMNKMLTAIRCLVIITHFHLSSQYQTFNLENSHTNHISLHFTYHFIVHDFECSNQLQHTLLHELSISSVLLVYLLFSALNLPQRCFFILHLPHSLSFTARTYQITTTATESPTLTNPLTSSRRSV